jgi:guanylate kinase
MSKKGIIVCISGFSGVGKGTLVKRLVNDYDSYALSVSMTTREPRQGEVNGKDYFFVSKEEFRKKINEGGLVEYAQYIDNYYGTPLDYVEKQLADGKDVILEIEIQGALQIREKYPTTLLMFVMPPDVHTLYERLSGRGTESREVIDKRMARAVIESEGIEQYDSIVINDDLDTCVKQMHEIIKGAHQTPQCNMDFIEQIRGELSALSKGE